VNPGAPTSTAPTLNAPAATAPSSFGSDVLSGLESTLGGTTLGGALGSALPYAGVAAIGMEQAKAGQAQDAASANTQKALAAPALGASNTLLNQYQTNTLNPTDKAVVDTGIAQGQDTIASAAGLSAIAQTAFANYNSGTLRPGDQAALDQQVASQKQQVAQQLASAGITDSTILAAQNQNIDNQALIQKNTILNSYFDTGNAAYNSYLTATQEGKAAITAAQTFASNSLQTYLTNSMAEANIGIGEVNTAIQTQMTTDAQYAAQVSTLLGTLATAYAKQIAGKAASGTSNPLSNLLKSATGGGVTAPAGTGGTSGARFGPTSDQVTTAQDNLNLDTNTQLDLASQTPDQILGDTPNPGDIPLNFSDAAPPIAFDNSNMADLGF
jgi:hypothetical protein